jgi:glycosidase
MNALRFVSLFLIFWILQGGIQPTGADPLSLASTLETPQAVLISEYQPEGEIERQPEGKTDHQGDSITLPRYRGRGNLDNDVLYYIQVDRFADGDPKNNIPLEAFPEDPNLPEATQKYYEQNRVLLPYLYDPTHRYINLYWGGDLAGITQKLDYLQGLGVTKIILSPIQDAANGLIYNPWQNGYLHDQISPEQETFDPFYIHASVGFNRSWTKDWWRIDEHLENVPDSSSANTPEPQFSAFRTLLNEAKKRNIGVILEFNLNHTSPYRGEDPYPDFDATQYQQWMVDQGSVYQNGQPIAHYTDAQTHQFNPENWFHPHLDIDYNRPTPQALEQGSVDGLPDLNHQNPAVRTYLLSALEFWLRFNQETAGITGFYLTSIPNVPLEFWQDLEAMVEAVNPQTILIADYGDGGYRNVKSMDWYEYTKSFDLVNYSFSVAARRFFGQDRGWDGRTMVLREDALGRSGEYYNAPFPGRFLHFMFNPSQSLEIPRSSLDRVRDQDAQAWINFLEAANQTRLLTYYPKMTENAYASAIQFLLTSPGVPLLFYGVETGLALPYHIDHRSPFGPGGDPFNEPMMIWPDQPGWNLSLYAMTRNLAHLRHQYPLLRYGHTEFLFPPKSHRDKDIFMLREENQCLESAPHCDAILYSYSTEGGDFTLDFTEDTLAIEAIETLEDWSTHVSRLNTEEQTPEDPFPNASESTLNFHLDPEASQVFVIHRKPILSPSALLPL